MNQSIGVMAELKWTLALTACLALFGCGKPDSPADQVRQAIEKLEAAAETRDISDFKAGIADSFRDREGRDTAQIANLVHGYFVLNQSIHLLTRINSLEFPTQDEARVKVSVAMVGREAETTNAWNLALEVEDFDVTLVRANDRWLVSFAEWRRSNRN